MATPLDYLTSGLPEVRLGHDRMTLGCPTYSRSLSFPFQMEQGSLSACSIPIAALLRLRPFSSSLSHSSLSESTRPFRWDWRSEEIHQLARAVIPGMHSQPKVHSPTYSSFSSLVSRVALYLFPLSLCRAGHPDVHETSPCSPNLEGDG